LGEVPNLITLGTYLVTNYSQIPRERGQAFGRPRRRWEDNIKIYLALDRDRRLAFMKAVMKLPVP
jgi:hypothetical protein